MPEYAPGTPSWVELSVADSDEAASFYGSLMGWTATEPGPVEETGGYRMFQQEDLRVAGLMGHMQPGQPTVWSTYISVANADDTAARVAEAGGAVVVAPMDVMDIGRMAFFSDPAGAIFGVWQPKTFTGADLVNEPNSLCWNELLTRDPEGSKAFYGAVFGWGIGRPQFEGGPEGYVVWEVDDKGVGGMMEMTDAVYPAEVPPHWGIVFEVADCGETTERARALGATVTLEPMTMDGLGTMSAFIDPQGATFAVIEGEGG